MNNYKINNNEICIARMDLMVDKNNKPYILEINSSIDLRGRESFKDKNYCEYLVKK